MFMIAQIVLFEYIFKSAQDNTKGNETIIYCPEVRNNVDHSFTFALRTFDLGRFSTKTNVVCRSSC